MSQYTVFDPENYVKKTYEVDGVSASCKAWLGMDYCAAPVDPIQKVNVFVPDVFAEGFDEKTVPIFVPNSVGGYMAGPADEPGRDFFGNPNAAFQALTHGYVVVCPGIRGRNSGKASDQFFIGGKADGMAPPPASGVPCGQAPALIVDQKAVIRWLRANGDAIPGSKDRIVTNGTSAGGALSALAGATGNSPDYEPYLKAIGAAEEKDDIFAAVCYCPIINLENADTAYEWLFNGLTDYMMMEFKVIDGEPRPCPRACTMDEDMKRVSGELKALFPAYVNSLGLTAPDGTLLQLNADGTGTFRDHVISLIKASAQKELDTHDTAIRLAKLAVPGSAVEEQSCLTIENGVVTGLDLPAYVQTITRMKAAPSFDSLDLSTPECEEFGTPEIEKQHFTAYAYANSKVGGTLAAPEIVKLLNPMNYVGKCDTAPHWHIRHGAFDRDTALPIPVLFAALLQNQGYDVDFCLPWGMPHSGDYDLDETFAWLDHLARE